MIVMGAKARVKLEIAKKGTKMEGTQFDVVLFDSKFTCTRCGKQFGSKDLIRGIGCDNCGSFKLTPPEGLASFGLARIEVGVTASDSLKVEGEDNHGNGTVHH